MIDPAMGHGVEGENQAGRAAGRRRRGIVATTLQALATPSRLLILTQLRQGARPVTELAEAVDMEQSAVSHQLRLLRNLGLVTGTRTGRSIVYSLYDNHVAQLLDEAVYHIEHVGMSARRQTLRHGLKAVLFRGRSGFGCGRAQRLGERPTRGGLRAACSRCSRF